MASHETDLRALMDTLYFRFEDSALLRRALTTNGYANEHNQGRPPSEHIESQEVLCTLGDAVLKLALVHDLMDAGSQKAGDITEKKAGMESRENLARLARKFDVGKFLMIGKGERDDQKLYKNPNTLAETMEALIGAIYLDVGFMATRRIIAKWEDL